ncbi:hypothetical protein [Caballeronia glebae]|uniref:hypothetical protein n=1 Tax=Caballeronia glebae TaxID=1777143 RepID=UPI0038BD92BE
MQPISYDIQKDSRCGQERNRINRVYASDKPFNRRTVQRRTGLSANAATGSSSVAMTAVLADALRVAFLLCGRAADFGWACVIFASDIHCSVYVALAGAALERSATATGIKSVLGVRMVGRVFER